MLTIYSSEAYCEKNVIKLLPCFTIIFATKWAKKRPSMPIPALFCGFFRQKNQLGVIKDILQNAVPARV